MLIRRGETSADGGEICVQCQSLFRELKRNNAKRTVKLRQASVPGGNPSSKVNLKHLDLATQRIRIRRRSRQIGKINEKLKILKLKLDKMTMQVNDSCALDLKQAMKLIKENHIDDLENVFSQTAKDCDQEFEALCRLAFEYDMKRNKPGSKGNRFTPITYRLAMAIVSQSPAAYERLKQFPMFVLPSQNSVRKMITHRYDLADGKTFFNTVWCRHHCLLVIIASSSKLLIWEPFIPRAIFNTISIAKFINNISKLTVLSFILSKLILILILGLLIFVDIGLANYIAEQAQRYFAVQHIKERPGLGKGVLIADECSVIGKITFNSKNGAMYGTATSDEEVTVYKGRGYRVSSALARICK